MPPESAKADRVRLIHILQAAKQALRFAQSRQRPHLDTDDMFRRALIHGIQEIGEAVSQLLSENTRNFEPSIPWRQIVGMRHRLVHVYFHLDLDLVWKVVQDDLTPLVEAVERLLTRSELA